MSQSRKIALSLLITVLISTGFAILAFTHLFDFLELRFYDPAIASGIREELNENSRIIQHYFDSMSERFTETLQEPAVKRSFGLTQTDADIYERSRILSSLQASLPGLQHIRFVDSQGLRIHYSNNPEDVLRQNGNSIVYRNYYEVQGYLPMDESLLSVGAGPVLRFESSGERLVFYVPFYDSFDVYQGLAIFSISGRSIIDHLLNASSIKITDTISIVSNPRGIVIGLSENGVSDIKNNIASLWTTGLMSLNALEDGAGNSYVLISAKTRQGIYVGRLSEESLFEFSLLMKALILGSTMLTIFIVFFLVSNISRDPVTLLQSRIKNLQVRLIEEYYDMHGDIDWEKWKWELEQRREEIRRELRRGLRVKKGSDIDVYIDSFFDKSWDDLVTAIGRRGGREGDLAAVTEDLKLEDMLKRILDAAGALLPEQIKKSAGTDAVRLPVWTEASGAAAAQAAVMDAVEPLEDFAAVNGFAPRREPAAIAAVPADDIEELEELEEIGEGGLPELSGAAADTEAVEALEVLADDADALEALDPSAAVPVQEANPPPAVPVYPAAGLEEEAADVEILDDSDEEDGDLFDHLEISNIDFQYKAPDTAVRENTAWKTEELFAAAKEGVAGAIMHEMRSRRETEKAEKAFVNTPGILAADPLSGSPVPPWKAPPPDPEEPETIEEFEEADESEIVFERMGYGRFIHEDTHEEYVPPETENAGEQAVAPLPPVQPKAPPKAGNAAVGTAAKAENAAAGTAPKSGNAAAGPAAKAGNVAAGAAAKAETAVAGTAAKAGNVAGAAAPHSTAAVGGGGLNALPGVRRAEFVVERPDYDDNSFDVEEFEEVTAEDLANAVNTPFQGPLYAFENPHKGTNINQIAHEIDNSPPKIILDDTAADIDIDISSPVDYMFVKDIVQAKEAVSAKLNPPDEKIIEERNGVHYIATGTLRGIDDAAADPKLKSLVADVLN
ncbi:MAG: hypothetical protein LBD20_00315 [Spirochaetaceae bacterium]|nr:hypothetical protein [Spirochaetaceae bacterium]